LTDDGLVSSREVKASYDGVKGKVRKGFVRAVKDIDDTGVRTCRENHNPFAFDVNRKKALVQNQRVRLPAGIVLCSPHVAGKSFLVTGDSRDLAADKKHPVKNHQRLVRYDRVAPMGPYVVRSWNLADRQQHSAR